GTPRATSQSSHEPGGSAMQTSLSPPRSTPSTRPPAPYSSAGREFTKRWRSRAACARNDSTPVARRPAREPGDLPPGRRACSSPQRAGGGTRTPNHLFTRQVRCQLRHASGSGREDRDRGILARDPGPHRVLSEDLPVEVGLQSARRLRAPLAVDGGTDLALQRLRRHGADDAVLARPDPALEGLLVADVEGAVHRAAAPLLDRGIGLRTTD